MRATFGDESRVFRTMGIPLQRHGAGGNARTVSTPGSREPEAVPASAASSLSAAPEAAPASAPAPARAPATTTKPARPTAPPPTPARWRGWLLRDDRRIIAAADAVAFLTLVLVAGAPLAVVGFVGAAVVWKSRGLYARRLGLALLDDLPALALGTALSLPATMFLGIQLGYSQPEFLLAGAGVLAAGALARTVSYPVVRRLRASGRVGYRALLMGNGTIADDLADRILTHPETGLRLVGSVGPAPLAPELGVPLLGSARDLPVVIHEQGVTHVVVGYSTMRGSRMVEALRTCDRLRAEIYLLPRLYELHSLRSADDHLWGVPLVKVRRTAHRAPTWRLKRVFDVTFAGTALVLLAPVMLATALAVRVRLGPGVIFRQIRTGLDGRPIELLKFRSMRPAAPGTVDLWKVDSPERLGRLGAFLRRYSLDELPQLVNVLRGDMSVVGPRPERPEFVELFSAEVPRYQHRHRVPVGLTGLAAVNGLRGDTSIHDRARFDNWYIENWSLWLDLKIIARTALAILRGTGS